MNEMRVLEALRAGRAVRRPRRARRRAAHSVDTASVAGHRVHRLSSHADDLHATFVPGAAMLGLSLRHRDEELLGLPHDLEAYVRTGAATGIPLLHPWANRIDGFRYTAAGRSVDLAAATDVLQLDDGGLPIHGVVGGRPGFQVLRAFAAETGAHLAAELDYGARPALLAAFPYPHRVRVEVSVVGPRLTVRTTVAAAAVPVPIAFGHHPYLRIPGATRAEWHVALPARTRLALDARGLPTGGREALRAERAPLGERVFDDLFEVGAAPAELAVAGAGRELGVRFDAGYPYAQVFAPAGADFICFEPMTAPVDALGSGDGLRLAAPGTAFSAEWSLEVRNAGAGTGTVGA
jgi:aldose 1-epimerase